MSHRHWFRWGGSKQNRPPVAAGFISVSTKNLIQRYSMSHSYTLIYFTLFNNRAFVVYTLIYLQIFMISRLKSSASRKSCEKNLTFKRQMSMWGLKNRSRAGFASNSTSPARTHSLCFNDMSLDLTKCQALSTCQRSPERHVRPRKALRWWFCARTQEKLRWAGLQSWIQCTFLMRFSAVHYLEWPLASLRAKIENIKVYQGLRQLVLFYAMLCHAMTVSGLGLCFIWFA